MSVLDVIGDSVAYARQRPAHCIRWSKWQREFLADESPLRLVRAGNQVGKTTVAAADVVMDLDGSNPYRPRRFDGPITVVFAGVSVHQMAAQDGPLEKLWSLLPQGIVDPNIWFESGRGIRGVKDPVIPIRYGPAAGSMIDLRTYAQHPQTMSGMTIHRVWCDEPLPERVYSELVPRILKKDGTLTNTMTPTPDMPDMAYMRELIASGVVREHHIPLTEEAAWPEGNAQPFYSQAQIDTFAASLPAHVRAMRIEASWDRVLTDRWLTSFNEDRITDVSIEKYLRADIVVGIDHGLKAGKQAAVLVLMSGGNTDRPRVAILDEYCPDEVSLPEDDARGILDMLDRNGFAYDHVDRWVGDQDAERGKMVTAKGNAQLRRELARQLGRPFEQTKWIEKPNKSRDTLGRGMNSMNAFFHRGHMEVDRRCVKWIESAWKFRGDPKDPVKDIMDAGRYAVMSGYTGPTPDILVANY